VEYYRGDRLVLINKGDTPYNSRANMVIREPLGEVFEKLLS